MSSTAAVEIAKPAVAGVNPGLFIDLGFAQCCKHGEEICGDAFKFRKSPDGDRVIAVISDGLGSGVKANILASMTASMALRFAAGTPDDILRAAEIMMGALPICQVRKISYATFTIVNAGLHGAIRVIEMGNPRFLLFAGAEFRDVPYRELESPRWQDRRLRVYNFNASPGDRMVFFSDGISQAGMGTATYPLGWRERGCIEFVSQLLRERPEISSHELGEQVLCEARRKEPGFFNQDDMTCASLHFRIPRELLIFTGPPYDPRHDRECAALIAKFRGETAVCGGTSAEIVSRELGRPLRMDLSHVSPEMPPMSYMEGVGLVTEGIFTLTRAAQYLESRDNVRHDNPAGRLVEMMLRNDVIELLVGTRINEAHQDPNLPQELELRRNIVARIARILETDFLKKVHIRYV